MDENQVGKKRRARRSGEEVERLVEEFVSSGMKSSEFSHEKLIARNAAAALERRKARGEANSATRCGGVG
jgi:hypothetical protein